METKKNIYKKLFAFQQDAPFLDKTASGYGYKYTPFAEILEKIKPVLNKHKLGFSQMADGENLKTVIFDYESGESLESTCSMGIEHLVYTKKINSKGNEVEVLQGFDGMNRPQAYGSMITYFKRYALSAMLGLSTDDDADGRNKRVEKAEKANLPNGGREELTPNHKSFSSIVTALSKKTHTIEQIENKYYIAPDNRIFLLKEAGI